MICCARTLPTPGIASSTATTFILPIDLVGVAAREHLGQGGPAGLQAHLQLRAGLAGGSGLLEGGGPLLGREGRAGPRGFTSGVGSARTVGT
jgi:hypothetical protein